MMPRPPFQFLRQQRGFTLLELLVATLAAAVLMAALLMALFGAWRLEARSSELESVTLPREMADQRLRREFQAAVPPAGLLAGPLTSVTATSGDWRHDEATWVTAIGATNPDTAWGDFVTVHYYLSESEQNGVYRLMRTEQRNLLALTEETPEETVILEGVVSFKLTWFDGENWLDSWDSTAQNNQLPQAVQVRLDFAGADQTRPAPLELIVPFVMRSLGAPTAASSGGPRT